MEDNRGLAIIPIRSKDADLVDVFVAAKLCLMLRQEITGRNAVWRT